MASGRACVLCRSTHGTRELHLHRRRAVGQCVDLRRGGGGSEMDGLEAGPVVCGDSGVGIGRIWASVFIYERFFSIVERRVFWERAAIFRVKKLKKV